MKKGQNYHFMCSVEVHEESIEVHEEIVRKIILPLGSMRLRHSS